LSHGQGVALLTGGATLTICVAVGACTTPQPVELPKCSDSPTYHVVIPEGGEVTGTDGMPCRMVRPQRLDVRFDLLGSGWMGPTGTEVSWADALHAVTEECNRLGGVLVGPVPAGTYSVTCRTVDF